MADQTEDITIKDSFETDLPEIEGGSEYRTASTGGQTTREATPPAAYIPMDRTTWTQRASNYLAAYANHSLMRSRFPNKAEAFDELRNEAEVHKAADRFVFIPLERAINCHYPISAHCEVKDGGIRTDVHYQHRGHETCVMILELKRRGNIDVDEFQDACAKSSSENDISDAMGRAELKRTKTLLIANAKIFSKQAGAYSQTKQCQNYVLFDWDTMIFLRFPKSTDKGYESPFCAEACILDKTQSRYFRKTLLGFLIEACQAAGIPKRTS